MLSALQGPFDIFVGGMYAGKGINDYIHILIRKYDLRVRDHIAFIKPVREFQHISYRYTIHPFKQPEDAFSHSTITQYGCIHGSTSVFSALF